jgi:hypothetical protein
MHATELLAGSSGDVDQANPDLPIRFSLPLAVVVDGVGRAL